jgi:hypothetical protein
MTDFGKYIGLPWEAGAQGPHAYDCMSFFRFIQANEFGIKVPTIIAPDYDNPTVLVGLFSSHGERLNWRATDTPQHGDAVMIRRPMHIGTWLDLDGGGVLHCVRGIGVVFTQDSSWRLSGFGRREIFRHNSIAP